MAISDNTLLTPTIIAKEALMLLVNNLGMAKHVYRTYKNEFRKVGQTITIRKPNKFRVTEARAIDKNDLTEPSTTLTVSTQAHVSWGFSSVELTQTVEQYAKRYIDPAASALANSVDATLCGLYTDVFNWAGTPGTTPNTFKVLGDAQTILDNESAPQGVRYAVMNPAANWTLADALKGTFAQPAANDIHTKGYLGQVANLKIFMDQNIKRHTTGAFTTSATPVMDETVTTGASTLSTDGWNATSSTVKDGDIFTIDTVNQVNTMTGVSTGNLKNWVVTANTTSTGSGDMTAMPIAPNVTYASTDPYSNCDAVPVDPDALTFVGTESTAYAQNLVFCKEAFCLVTLPLEMPANVWGARETDKDAGISIRIIKQYDIDNDEEICRMDILYGTKTLYPELAVRVWGE
ncbi:MAG: hypothetical protein GY714_20295 [Desulfobacterales bacterium]|nr:hypothetical protein [Desulfobacterales bacterium]